MNPSIDLYRRNYHSIIFDLDGTLIDSKEGIIKSIQYALSHFGIPSPEEAELAAFIGTPLPEIFSKLVTHPDQEMISDLVAMYRERYNALGIFENIVYPGVELLLQQLMAHGCLLFIATTKPQHFAIQILKHLKLDHYFVNIYGSFLDGKMNDKSELCKWIMDSHKIKRPSLMVGDRKFDIIAARDNQIESLGVLYGYGAEAELRNAQANYLAATPLEIAEWIVR